MEWGPAEPFRGQFGTITVSSAAVELLRSRIVVRRIDWPTTRPRILRGRPGQVRGCHENPQAGKAGFSVGGANRGGYIAGLCGRGGTVDATDLKRLECSPGNRRCRTAQIRGNPSGAIPSQAPRPNRRREGVETRRAAPKARTRYGEGIVQTTNSSPRGRARRGGASRSWYENPLGETPCRFDSGRPHHDPPLPDFRRCIRGTAVDLPPSKSTPKSRIQSAPCPKTPKKGRLRERKTPKARIPGVP